MLDKLNNKKYQITELIIIFIITLLFNLLCNDLIHDEIWNYGFTYNIATGLIPYKDFNMVITPLFPMIGALWMLLFGKTLVSYHIFNAIICTTIFYYMKKDNPKSYYIPYGILLFFSLPNYNLFCLLLLYILMNLENNKKNDYLIGFVLGIAFLTKQTIGICLCLPTLFTKDKKKIFKRLIGFIIPNIFLILYLLYNDTIYEFIDYTFLGIGDFANKNFNYYHSCIIFVILSLIYLTYKYYKTKDIKLIYLLCFQIVAYPIIDPYHVMIPFIPTFSDFLKNLKLNKKIIQIAFAIFMTIIFFNSIYLCMINKYMYPNETTVYKYRKMNNNVNDSLKEIKEYLSKKNDKIFIIDMYAYMIKLETSMTINKYDLLNDGNLGKNGEIKIINDIKETCQKEKCTFLLNEREIENRISQYNQKIIKFISQEYKKVDNIKGISVYQNY